MPELPEVETIVRDLAPRLVRRTLRSPQLYKTDVLRGVTRPRLLAALRDRRVAGMTRRAKHIIVQLESGLRMVIQLRMTGSLLIDREPLTAEQRRYAVLTAGLGRGETLVFRDVRPGGNDPPLG